MPEVHKVRYSAHDSLCLDYSSLSLFSFQPVNVEGLVMFVSSREQVKTANGMCPICRITLEDNHGAQRIFGLWRGLADTPAVLQSTTGTTVLTITAVTYNTDQGYSTSKTRYIPFCHLFIQTLTRCSTSVCR